MLSLLLDHVTPFVWRGRVLRVLKDALNEPNNTSSIEAQVTILTPTFK